MEENYTPRPAELSGIELPHNMKPLLERMAENTHDLWAQKRLEEGWTYGPARDDAKKKHPCLVPYDELSESEKEYDRQTAVQALKFILSEGFIIFKKKIMEGC